MEARGFYAQRGGLAAAPLVRIGIGFGRGSVVGTAALIDTGADVCVFPSTLFRFPVREKGEPDLVLEMADGSRIPARVVYPSITAGDIREREVASVVLPNTVPILGRSFLNRLAVRLTAALNLVRLETVGAPRIRGP
jgi:predicted aspartyl protease